MVPPLGRTSRGAPKARHQLSAGWERLADTVQAGRVRIAKRLGPLAQQVRSRFVAPGTQALAKHFPWDSARRLGTPCPKDSLPITLLRSGIRTRVMPYQHENPREVIAAFKASQIAGGITREHVGILLDLYKTEALEAREALIGLIGFRFASPRGYQIKDPSDVPQHILRRPLHQEWNRGTWYFTYGANLTPAVLVHRRKIHPVYVLRAKLPDYQLRFNAQGIPFTSEKVYANIEPKDSSSVPGALFYLKTGLELRRHDLYEGAGLVYNRVPVQVTLDNGQPVQAWAYRAYRKREDHLPTKRYQRLMLEGAQQMGFFDNYIRLPGDSEGSRLIMARARDRDKTAIALLKDAARTLLVDKRYYLYRENPSEVLSEIGP